MKPPVQRRAGTARLKSGIIHVGDVLSELKKIAAASVQVVMAAPPYFQVLAAEWDRQWRTAEDFLAWSLAWLGEAMRVLRPDGLLYCFGQLGKREHTFLHLMSEAAWRWPFHDVITCDGVGDFHGNESVGNRLV